MDKGTISKDNLIKEEHYPYKGKERINFYTDDKHFDNKVGDQPSS